MSMAASVDPKQHANNQQVESIVKPGDGTADKTTGATPPPAIDDLWADASKDAVVQGDIRVRVTSVLMGKVPLKGVEGAGESKDVLLQITVTAENLSKNKLIHLKAWGSTEFTLTGFPGLTDNFDNSYRACSFSLFDRPVGQIAGEADVRPGEQVSDLLVFDRPLDTMQYLRLSLPAANFGGTGKLRLQIPANMIRAANAPAANPPSPKAESDPAAVAAARAWVQKQWSDKLADADFTQQVVKPDGNTCYVGETVRKNWSYLAILVRADGKWHITEVVLAKDNVKNGQLVAEEPPGTQAKWKKLSYP
jgi:hypothetical protein